MSYADECLKRANKATKAPYRVERIDHDDGIIAYEINDDNQLVAFYEFNFDEPVRAKFNAEFYAAARTDVVELATRLKISIEIISALLESSECRQDEDCDHCVALQGIEELERPLE